MRLAGLLVILAVVMIVFFSSLLIPALIMLIIPGRKGFLRTTRDFQFPGTAEEAFDLMQGRLEYEGFEVIPFPRPHLLKAYRAAKHHEAHDTTIVTHATKPLQAEIQFQPAGQLTRVKVTLWMKDFVLLDSGEGRQIDLMLHRLIEAQLDKERPPTTSSTHVSALMALTGAIVTLALAAIPFYWPWLAQRHLLSFGIGIIIGALVVWGIGSETLKAASARPDEVTGKPLAYFSFLLAAVALLGGAAWAVTSIIQTFQRI